MKILVVEDDRDLVELLNFVLKRAEYEVDSAYDGPAGRERIASQRPDLVLLDLNLGASNGIDLLRELRQTSDVPVIVITGRDREGDVIESLEAGADDYIRKPFSHRELIARVRAVLRRRGRPQPLLTPDEDNERLVAGPLMLDPKTRITTIRGESVKLTITEFRLLRRLMERPGAVVTGADILKDVWGYDFTTVNDVARATVHRIRRKIERDPAKPQLLQTVQGVGFRIDPGAG